jgi:RNA polymerase sigma factor (sigma-70 family)
MMNPFLATYDTDEEMRFIKEAQEGSRSALERLIKLHQRFIYNVALKLVRNPEDAADLTQEVLIKMVTRLSQFKGKSSFRTWLYRIVFNHFIKNRDSKTGLETASFEGLGDFLDDVHTSEEMSVEEQMVYSDLIDDTRNKCMSGMLLCMDRQQRIIFILGAIFNLKSTVAAPLLQISPANFRKQLSRARADLFQFMENKCGLINPGNPCRCHKKTMGFIKEGKVEPKERKFVPEALETIRSVSPQINDELDQLMEDNYMGFFKAQNYEKHEAANAVVQSLLFNKEIKTMFHIN